tara:strand:- start:33 stop:704 length:672 start_codon:yes stop_codon:yes gene_type:complete
MPHGGYHGYSASFVKKAKDKAKKTPKTFSSIKSAVKKDLGITATKGGFIAANLTGKNKAGKSNKLFYGSEASKLTNEYLVKAGLASKTGGGGYLLSSKGWEMKYGSYNPGAAQNPGAMGSGNPNSIMGSVPISKEMLKQQNKIKAAGLAVMGFIGAGTPVGTVGRAMAGKAYYDATIGSQRATEIMDMKFQARQEGKKFTQTNNVFGVLGLQKGNSLKDKLGL